MSSAADFGAWLRNGVRGWDRFWFTPADPLLLGLIRIAAGAMLFYTHFVWGLNFAAFFGEQAWIRPELARELQGSVFAWSHFWLMNSPTALWIMHLGGLAIFAMLTIGAWTRCTSILAALITLSYIHRLPGALFGLDQINSMLALYMAVGPSGDALSFDQWKKTGSFNGPRVKSVSANIALRLIQLHMCVIYVFAGMAKLQGQRWWNGMALWGAAANLEYQSVDMTWLASHPNLVSIMTYTVLYWELAYAGLIWPRWTRPIMLLLAIPLHLGIAFFLGMMTFGLIMLVGNAAFIPQEWLYRWFGPSQERAKNMGKESRTIPAPKLANNALLARHG